MGVLSLPAPHRHHDLAGSLRRPRAFWSGCRHPPGSRARQQNMPGCGRPIT